MARNLLFTPTPLKKGEGEKRESEVKNGVTDNL